MAVRSSLFAGTVMTVATSETAATQQVIVQSQSVVCQHFDLGAKSRVFSLQERGTQHDSTLVRSSCVT